MAWMCGENGSAFLMRVIEMGKDTDALVRTSPLLTFYK